MVTRMSDDKFDDDISGFGLPKLKREPTKEEFAAHLKLMSKFWEEQRAAHEKIEQEQWLAVVAETKAMMERGESAEAIAMMIREAFEPEDTMSDLDE